MKQTIEMPWFIGDIGWAILERDNRKTTVCEACGVASHKLEYLKEVKECRISAIEITIRPDGKARYYYHVAFDIGETSPQHGRFTYGTHRPNVFASKQEAEDFLNGKCHE